MKLKLLTGLLISSAFFAVLVWVVPLDRVIGDLKALTPGIAVASFLFYSASHITRSLRWKVILRDINLLDVTLINSANVFLNNLLPARTGDLSWFYYANKIGVSLKVSLWSFFVARVYDLMGMIFTLAVSLLFLKDPFLGLLGVSACIFLVIVVPKAYLVLPERGRLSDLRGFLKENLTLSLSLKVASLSTATFLLKFASVYLLTSQIWGMDLVRSVAAFTGGELTTVLPLHGVAGYGTYETGFLVPLRSLGVDIETGIRAGFLAHSFLLLSSALWGIPSIAFLHTLSRRSR